MKQVISFLLLLPAMIFFMFQPFYNEIYSLRQTAVEIVLDVGTQKAAIEGYFSPDNVSHMRSLLINNLRYSEGEIEFTGTTVRRERGEYLEGTLSVPSGRLWVLPLLGEDGPDRIFSYSKIMSEYIPNE